MLCLNVSCSQIVRMNCEKNWNICENPLPEFLGIQTHTGKTYGYCVQDTSQLY